MRLRQKYLSGGFKGIVRKKSDDQPGKAVRSGTGQRLSGRTIPNKATKPTGMPGTARGKCLLAVGKESGRCECGGHHPNARRAA